MPAITLVPNPQAADGKPVVIDYAGPKILPGYTTLITLTEDATYGDPVTVDGRRANSDDLTTFRKFLGLVGGNQASMFHAGEEVVVYVATEVVKDTWSWNTGSNIFLAGTGLSASPPTSGYLQPVGMAKDAKTLMLLMRRPIQL